MKNSCQSLFYLHLVSTHCHHSMTSKTLLLQQLFFFFWYSNILNVLFAVKRLRMLFFFSSLRSNQSPSHWALTQTTNIQNYTISAVWGGKKKTKKHMHCFFSGKQSSVCQLNPQVASFQTVRYKISKWNICSSLLFYNHINWQMSLGNRGKHISHYMCFYRVMLLASAYHAPKRPSQQETELAWIQRAASFLPMQTSWQGS